MEFITAIFDTNFIFLRNALLAGLLSSVLFGILGTLVTVKRIAGLAGAVSHAVLGGIGMALFFSTNKIIPGFSPLLGAFIFALLSAFIIGIVSIKAKQREDTVINAVWAIGMSSGVLFISKSAGFIDGQIYLFGNILLVSNLDLILMAGLGLLVIILVWRFFKQLEISSFDEEYARVRGIPVTVIFIVLLSVCAAAIVLLQSSVGILMVIAMLTLPSGTAASFTVSLHVMMIWSVVFSAVFSVGGLYIGWVFDAPAGAVTVILAGAVFLTSTIVVKLRSCKS